MSGSRRPAWALVLGLALGACGESGESPEPSRGGPASGGTAVVCSPGQPEGLNPFVSADQGTEDLKLLLYTPLVLYGGEGGFRPYLARQWSWSEDGRRLDLALRSDLHWHDGEPVTARDVAFTLRRAADPEYGYYYQSDFSTLAGVEALDSATVALLYEQPSVVGLEPLVALPILPEHLLGDLEAEEFRRAGYHREPVGSGPFRFAERGVDGSIVFEKASAFPEDLGRPRLERLVYRVIPEASTLAAELRSGAVDVCIVPSGMAGQLRGREEVDVLLTRPSGVHAIFLNTQRSSLSDPRVRRALSAALRRVEIASLVSPLASAGRNPLPPESPWRDSTLRQPDADSAAAARWLDRAGWLRGTEGGPRRDASGAELRLQVVAPQEMEDALTAMQAQLGRIGVAVQMRFMEFAAYVRTIMDPASRPDVMAVALYDNKVVAPDYFAMFHSEGPQNLAEFEHPALDSILDRLAVTPDTAERRELYRGFQRILVEEVPVLFTVYVPRLVAVGPDLEGVEPGPNGPLSSVHLWRVDP